MVSIRLQHNLLSGKHPPGLLLNNPQ